MRILSFVFSFVLLGIMVQAQGNSGNNGPLPVVAYMKVDLTSPTTALVEVKISGRDAKYMSPTAVINVSGDIVPGGSSFNVANAISGIVNIGKGQTYVLGGSSQVIFTTTIEVESLSADQLSVRGVPQFLTVSFNGHTGTAEVKRTALCCVN